MWAHFLPLQAAISASVVSIDEWLDIEVELMGAGGSGGCGRGDLRGTPLPPVLLLLLLLVVVVWWNGDGVCRLRPKYSVLGDGVSDRSARSVADQGAGERATSVW